MRKMRQPTGHHRFHQDRRAVVLSVAGAILALFVFSRIMGSSHTGYAVASLNTILIDETAFDGTRLVISSTDGRTIPLNAARITGKVYGPGTAKVYLAVGEVKLQVYSSTREPGEAGPEIEPVGRVARERYLDASAFNLPSQPGRTMMLSVIEDPGRVFELAIYGNQYKDVVGSCGEACRLHGSLDSSRYTLVFQMDPGTAFRVESIGFI